MRLKSAIGRMRSLVPSCPPRQGSGSPEGVVEGRMAAVYLDTSTTPPEVWIKETLVGKSGWLKKSTTFGE